MTHPEFTCSVVVQPIAERTDPANQQYAYAYTVTIRNTGDTPAQLVARHWIIVDQRGQTEEVRGLGVVGQQPLLQPGEQFEYTSWTELNTPQGSMHGIYICYTQDAQRFEATVPEFMLGTARDLH
ncbi:MAG: Co2+/Mg2+ efflux protein ApaG [Leptothrix sp. (in: b-proteobacteria)]